MRKVRKVMNIYDDKDFFERYAGMSRSKKGLPAAGEWYIMEPLMPDFEGKNILDLGCGYGWHCRYAAGHKAKKVVGIDESERMIAAAKEKNDFPSIEYKVCRMSDYDYPKEEFDAVISNLALHYVEDIEDIYKKVFSALKKDGVFLFNIEHPVFTAGVNQDWVYSRDGKPMYWPVDNYYYRGERQTDFLGRKVVKYHHTLTQILDGLIGAGFEIQAVREAEPSGIYAGTDEMRRPMMLIVRCKKR